MPSATPLSQIDSNEQKRHFRAILGAIGISVAMMLWLSFGATAGYLSWAAVAACAIWSVAAFGGVWAIHRSGLNQRFIDPAMTMPLLLAAVVFVLGVAHVLHPTYRTAVLPWVTTAFAFAAFSSRGRAVARQTAVVSGLMLVEAALYVYQNGQSVFLTWQTIVILSSILSIGAFCASLNEKRAAAVKMLSLNKTVLDSVAEAVVSLDMNGKVIDFNRAAQRLTNTPLDQAIGKSLDTLLLPAAQADIETLHRLMSLQTHVGEELPRAQISSLVKGRDEAIELECTPATVLNRKGKLIGQVLVVRDVSDAARLMRKLEYDSNHDELTKLLNRRGFLTALDRSVSELGSYSEGTRHGLMVIDLDQFKIVNDTCGHAAGDSLLTQVAGELARSVRDIDVVARYGGDEFAVILHAVDADTTARIADSILRSIGGLSFEWGGRRFQTGASIGCVMFDQSDRDAGKIIRKADSALYLAKDLGRGRMQVHADGDEQVAKKSRDLEWACRINDALELDAFELYAQRVSCNNAQREDHFEILVRMREPDGQIVAPDEFIPSAERFGLMPALDRWVIRSTLAMLDQLADDQQATPKVAINLSAQSVNDRDFLPFLMQVLGDSRVPSNRICFELTETVAIANFDTAKAFIDSIRAMGCTFALDDVGAGFNSFNYLRLLTFDSIKIDGHYIRNLEHNPVDRALVESLVQAAASLGLDTVAEMVETEATATNLREMGVDQLQGFGIHRPEPLGSVLEGIQASAKRTEHSLATVA